MKEDVARRQLTEADRIAGFKRATGGFAGAGQRWKERAARGMTDAELAEALAWELGIMGGSAGPGSLSLHHQGAGLKIWISWDIRNTHQCKPAFEGKSTIAMARLVYGIKDPADTQLALFLD
ncbi:MAG: hypothetical protein ACREDT_01550 [Methylocella sp.]